MATKYKGGKVLGATDLPAKAAGDAAATGMPKAVAPDVISTPRAAKSGYGQNGFAGPSSLTPMDDSNAGTSLLAANIKAASEQGDAVLDSVVKYGSAAMRAPEVGDDVEDVRGTPATQIRKIADSNVPDHPSMASARSRQPSYPGPREQIPSTLGASSAQPERKPGA